jgi:hypothetical protein
MAWQAFISPMSVLSGATVRSAASSNRAVAAFSLTDARR